MPKRPVPYAMPERHRQRNAPQVSVYAVRRTNWPLRIALVIVLLGLASLGIRALPHLSLPHPAAQPPAPTVTSFMETGTRNSGAFVVGQPIHLSWASTPKAQRYHLQVAPSAGSFQHPLLTAVTSRTFYDLRLSNPGAYAWRVQGGAGSRWGPYSRPHAFAVVPPAVGRPALRRPANRAITGRRVTLCWSAVGGASGYYLQLASRRPLRVSGTCHSMTLAPGRVSWRVAAFVRARSIYVGSYSPPRQFRVAPPTPASAPAPAPAAASAPPGAASSGATAGTAPVGAAPSGGPPSNSSTQSPPSQTPPSQSSASQSGSTPAQQAPAPSQPSQQAPAAPSAPAPAPAQPSTGQSKPSSCIPFYTC